MKVIRNIFYYIIYLLRLLNPITMLQGMWKDRDRLFIRLEFLINVFPSEPVEMLVGLTLFGWGIFLTAASIFDNTMILSLPSWIFGTLAIYVGFSQIYTLLSVNDVGRKHSALLAFLLWVFIAITIFAVIIPGISIVIFSLIVGNIWIYYRAGRPTNTGMLKKKVNNE